MSFTSQYCFSDAACSGSSLSFIGCYLFSEVELYLWYRKAGEKPLEENSFVKV